VRLGKVSGDGYRLVQGKVDGFRATYTGILEDSSGGWRVILEMETRGKFDTLYEERIEQFFKKLKWKNVK
jgi:hypothetical protein